MKQQKADIVCLQETNLKSSEAKLAQYVFREDIYQSFAEQRSVGVLVGIKAGLPWVINSEIIDPMGQYVILDGVFFSQKLTIIGVYDPNQGQTVYWDILKQHLLACEGEGILLLGDLNATMNNKIDRSGNSISQDLPKSFTQLMIRCDLLDVWREKNSTTRDYSFFSQKHQSYCGIDMIFVSRNIFSKVLSSNVGQRHLSDHTPVIVTLREPNDTRKTWSWRLNNFLLEATGAKEKVTSDIEEFFFF